MLQKKIEVVNSDLFKPFPFVLKKDRRRNVIVESKQIQWDLLTKEQIDSQWSHCLNSIWYSEKEGIVSIDNFAKYLEIFLQKHGYSENDIKAFNEVPAWMKTSTMHSVAYLIETCYRKTESIDWLKSRVDECVRQGQKLLDEKKIVVDAPQEKPRMTIQEAMANQLSDLLGELEGMDDEKLETKHNILNWLRAKNVAKVHLDSIETRFRPRLEELNQAINKEDDHLIEGYSRYKKNELKRMVEWYETLLTDVDAYRRLKVSSRKVRARKPKPPSQLVRSLKYLNYFDDLKITSINSEKIIGADSLWVYNVKYKRLICYTASEIDKELTVKGSTIMGWDPKASYGKTLRKPADQLIEFMKGGKVSMRNFLKAIKGKDKIVNGRINKDCLLLKVY